MDIKPHITVLDSKELEDSFEVTLKLPCGSSFNLNVNVVIDTFCERYGIEISEIYTERTKILMRKFYINILAKGFEMWYNIKAFELPSVLPTRVNATPLNERHDIKAGSPLALQR